MASPPRIFYDLMDRLIDSQISNTTLLNTLVHMIGECKSEIKDLNNKLAKDFQGEIKDSIKENSEALNQKLDNIAEMIKSDIEIQKALIVRTEEEKKRNEKIDKTIIKITKASTYIKWIVAVIVAIGTIIGGMATIMEAWPWQTPNKQETPE